MEEGFTFQWGEICFSFGESFILNWRICPMGDLMAGSLKKRCRLVGECPPPHAPHYGGPCDLVQSYKT